MAGSSARDFTKDKLGKMAVSGAAPANIDRDKDSSSDDYGRSAAKGSDASQFKKGGSVGFGKKPHMGRPGRASGGRINGQLLRTRRTDSEAAEDFDSNADDVGGREAANKHDSNKETPKLNKGGWKTQPPTLRAKGGRIGRQAGGGLPGLPPGMPPQPPMMPPGAGGPPPPMRAGGRIGRARGGRAGKGKTTVNIVIGGRGEGQGQQPQAAPPPPPPPMPPPMPPPRPPMMPPGGMPPGMGMPGPAGPPGAAGPPGGMPPPPMPRARGGRIEISPPGKHDFGTAGTHAFGKGGTKGATAVKRSYGAGSGLGRQESARLEK